MADQSTTAHVFPSANDVHGALASGWGKTMYESNIGPKMHAAMSINNFVVSGGLLPASDADLQITVPACVAYLDGRYVSVDAQAVTVGASVTTHLFLKLLKDANLNVSSVAYETNTTGTPPADSTKIGTLVSDSDNITSTTDARLLGPGGVIAITSGVSWPVPAGLYRIFVEVKAGGGGGGGGGAGSQGANGTAGGAGGTTTFDTLTATGGAGGAAGLEADTAAGSAGAGGANGTGSGGTINTVGGGGSRGSGGAGAQSTVIASTGSSGSSGGDGGYAAGFLTVTPGTDITTAVGAAGTAGGGGTATTGGAGGAGRAGQAGLILVWY